MKAKATVPRGREPEFFPHPPALFQKVDVGTRSIILGSDFTEVGEAMDKGCKKEERKGKRKRKKEEKEREPSEAPRRALSH